MKNLKNLESSNLEMKEESIKSLKNFKPINPEGVKGTILSGCDLPGDALCGCFIIVDTGHHCDNY